MKTISRLLILCLLLCGCAKKEAVEPVFTPVETVAVPGLYDRGSNLEISSSGAVRVYPLSKEDSHGFFPFADGILLFSGEETTTLTLLCGDTLIPTVSKTLAFSLEPESCALCGNRFSYFDPVEQQTVVLNRSLETEKTIPAPAELLGMPVLSPDGNVLYYCTPTTVRAWDLNLDIHRILRQSGICQQWAEGLYCGGTVLRCGTETGCFFLSTSTGELLHQEDTDLKLAASGDGYIAASWETNLWSLVFQTGGETKALTPRSLSADYFLLPQSNSVVTAAVSGEVVTLDHYDLTSGKRTASQMVRGSAPQSITGQDGAVWVLLYMPEYESQVLLRWDPSRTPVSDSHIYTGPHFTAGDPDTAGLKACQDYADQIGQRYGLNILLWQDASSLAPEGITVKPEHRVNILRRELELLDHRLSQFPEGLLQTTASSFHSFHIGLVAQIGGGIREDSLQFFSGKDAIILLAVGNDSESALYHQLFHVMQTHILSHSSAFDQWASLNPQGFQYDYDYAANAIRNSGIYLTEDNRYFLDTFSMSYPKEDRARLFEYAMLPEKGQLFRSKYIQKKLKAICTSIREAYSLSGEEPYPWEQYLR